MYPDNKPLAKQGAVTVVTSIDPSEAERRIRLSTDPRTRGERYEGGGDKSNYPVLRHDLLLGVRAKTHLGVNGQKTYETVISAWNGRSREGAKNEQDLAEDYYFAGFSLTEYDPTKARGPRTALTTLVAGPVQIRLTGDEAIYAGDTVRWVPPPFNPTKRRRHRFTGQPFDKLHTVIKRLDWNDIRKVQQITFLNSIEDATLATSLASLGDHVHSGDTRRALALTKHCTMTLIEGVRDLATRSIITINDPAVKQRRDAIFAALRSANLTGTARSLDELELGVNNGGSTLKANLDRVQPTSVLTGNNLEFSTLPLDAAAISTSTESDFFQDFGIQSEFMRRGNSASTRGETAAAVENSLLWLATRVGTIDSAMLSQGAAENTARLRESLLKNIHHVYVDEGERATYTPTFAHADPTGRMNAHVKQYIQFAADAVLEYEQMTAEHKNAIGRTAIGVCMTSASPNATDPKLDLLTNFPGGNVVV